MDWREDDFAAGFVFDNPNAKGACRSGELPLTVGFRAAIFLRRPLVTPPIWEASHVTSATAYHHAFRMIAYAIFFATFLYLIAFVGNLAVVPRTVDFGPAAPPATAVAIDHRLIAFSACSTASWRGRASRPAGRGSSRRRRSAASMC